MPGVPVAGLWVGTLATGRHRKENQMGMNDVTTSSGTGWLLGWLFTIGFLDLGGWAIVWAAFIWPYHIGVWARGLL